MTVTMNDADLHVYLETKPSTEDIKAFLSVYGFSYLRTEEHKAEPVTDYYRWKVPSENSYGFDLMYFHELFADDLNHGNYSRFIIMSASPRSKALDLSMIDTMAVMLLKEYGGRLHNPQRISKISTSFLLSGEPFTEHFE